MFVFGLPFYYPFFWIWFWDIERGILGPWDIMVSRFRFRDTIYFTCVSLCTLSGPGCCSAVWAKELGGCNVCTSAFPVDTDTADVLGTISAYVEGNNMIAILNLSCDCDEWISLTVHV